MIEDIIEFSAELQLRFVPGEGKVLQHGDVVEEKSRLAKCVAWKSVLKRPVHRDFAGEWRGICVTQAAD